jgi:hypothetical protein
MQLEDCLLPSTARPLPSSVMARSAYRHTVRAVTRSSIFGVIWASLVLVAEVSAKRGIPLLGRKTNSTWSFVAGSGVAHAPQSVSSQALRSPKGAAPQGQVVWWSVFSTSLSLPLHSRTQHLPAAFCYAISTPGRAVQSPTPQSNA